MYSLFKNIFIFKFLYPPPRLARRRAWGDPRLLATVYSPYSLSATVYSLQSAVYSLQSTVKTINWGSQPGPAAVPVQTPPPLWPSKNS